MDPQAAADALAAALVHDLGHGPFSHLYEDVLPDARHHESWTLDALRDDATEVHTALETLDPGMSERVAALLAGSHRLGYLGRAVSGTLDVDRCDYLLRDSHMTGVRYGLYDLDRLLDTVRPLEAPDGGGWGIGVEEGGLHAVEALVMARYYMFTQVYFNPTGKALELHLNEWLRESGRRWPAEVEEFLALDDVEVTVAMRRSASRHARAIVDRRHDPLAFETDEHLAPEERDRFLAVLEEVEAEMAPGDVLWSHSAKDPHRLERSGVLVRHRDGRLEPLAEASHFIRHLGRIERFRVYSPAGRRDAVAAAIRRRWQET